MPAIARKVDRKGTHVWHMIFWSALAALVLLTLSLTGAYVSATSIFILYFLFNVFFQAGYVFSSALLHVVSTSETRVQVSGIGQTWGQAGNLIGVIVSFFTVSHLLVAPTDKLNVFFWSAIVFMGILILVSRMRIDKSLLRGSIDLDHANKDDEGLGQDVFHAEVASLDKKIWQKLKSKKKITFFLIAYALYSDAVVTLTLFVALYFKKVLLFTDTQIRISSLILLVSTMIGGIVVAKYIKAGSEVRMLKILLLVWPVAIILFAIISHISFIYVLLVCIGLAMSTIFALSRAYYTYLIPKHEQAEFFSLFVVFERVGAMVGPIFWSAIVSLSIWFGTTEIVAYKIAISSVACMTAVGYIFLRKSNRLSN
jgi:UMF1 family MFS transporter